ncbi:VWA domain-containing protein [Methylococcus geothermalis]|uniref:VWA domain-containing protein n=1 Tax=Methylococcus geothermalis TaxID=2681310 RepID=A0A858Q4Z7_9GAMM|nr:VWA domain-containing protein [Methylococcus geothermalis]QJD28901.1 VWA domain-containing protein [Methylococcus geothermalis]
MNEFHFLRPLWLAAWIPLVLALWYWRRREQGEGDWTQVCDGGLLPHLLIGTAGRTGRLSWWLGAMAGTLAVLAAAGPAWERQQTPGFRSQSALVIALELSPAMDAADLQPSRLTRLRYAVTDLLKHRKDGQTALLVYGGDAFTVTPLTDDVDTIDAQLPALSSDLVPTAGHDVERALTLAAQLLRDGGFGRGDILLAAVQTDPAAEAAAARLRGEGFRVSVLGVGTEAGAPIPLRNGGFRKAANGEIELSRLDESALRQLAEQGGGRYLELSAGATATDALASFFEQNSRLNEGVEAAMKLALWEDRGPWLLLLVLPLAALGFRRGWLAVLVLGLPLPRPAEALDWQGLWQTPDQQAAEAFQAGQFDEAARTFRNPAWQSAAEYRAGNYEEAAKSLEGLDTADAAYNRGNALARAGKLSDALKAYDQALRLDPNDEDARHNREAVEEALKRQQQQQKPRSDSENRDQEQKDQQQDQQDPNGSNQDQENPQGQKSDQDQSREHPKPDEKAAEQAGEPNREQQHETAEGHQQPPPPSPQPQEQAGEEGGNQEQQMPQAESRSEDEKEQATEQWLKRIPDDPGGLLRRKFLYQYRQRQQRSGGQ